MSSDLEAIVQKFHSELNNFKHVVGWFKSGASIISTCPVFK